MAETNQLIALYTGKVRVRVCGICLAEEKVLVVRHKPTIGNTAFWAPPGGGLAFGERVRDCLAREVAEETGLTISPGKFLGIHEFIRNPLHAIELFFEAQVQHGQLKAGRDPEAGPQAQLIQEVHFLSLPDLRLIEQQNLHPIFNNLTSLADLLLYRSEFFPMSE